MDPQHAAAWVSNARFAPFLEAAARDHDRAVALYEWHAGLAAICFEMMGHFEVLVRNAIDSKLGEGHPDAPLKDTWLLDFDVLRPDGIKQVIVAAERLERGRSITRGRIVAGLAFGFWVGLFGPRYEELWRHRLRHAFPNAKERKDLSTAMQALRRFRNRLAHHDCILSQPVGARHEDMLRVAGYIDSAATSWLGTNSRVRELLDRRPADT